MVNIFLSILILFNFSSFKEWFYEHKKYEIDNNFKELKIRYSPLKNLTYKVEIEEREKDLFLSFKADQNIYKNSKNRYVTTLSNIKQFHKIGDKKYKNREIKYLKNSKFTINYSENLIKTEIKSKYFDPLIEYLLNFDIKFLKQKTYVGTIWYQKKSVNYIRFKKGKVVWNFNDWIKFLGYKGDKKILKITHYIDIIEEPFTNLENLNGKGNSIIKLKDGFIESIETKIKIFYKDHEKTITFKKNLIKK